MTSNEDVLAPDKLERLQQLQVFKGGKIASKLRKMKLTPEESAAAAISLSKVMARKKGAEIALQVEIETEAQWKLLLRKEGLIVVEVYAGWCGPCLSMATFLKKVKVDTDDDRLTLAVVNSDVLVHLPDIRLFRNQSEPTWIFIGGGKPVRLLRGANPMNLVAAIKSEFQHELLCLDGKAKRNLISLKDEVERRYKAKAEAIQITLAMEEEERERIVVPHPSKVPTPSPTPKQRSVSPQPSEEKASLNASPEPEDLAPADSDQDQDAVQSLPSVPTAALTALEMKNLQRDPVRDAINARLSSSLDSFTILAIQGFLLETGAVTEIKDLIQDEFTIIKERIISLEDTGVRDVFGITFEFEELIEDEEEREKGSAEGDVDQDTTSEHLMDDPEGGDAASVVGSEAFLGGSGGGGGGSTTDGENQPVSEFEGEGEEPPVVVVMKEPQYRKIPIPLPPELEGDTLLFLLESGEVAKQKQLDPDAFLAKNADDFLRFRVGPTSYADAVDNEPKSMLAIYGRDEYSVGVWCPRTPDDKRYVMLNYFPQTVMEILMPPPKEMPKYMVAIFPPLFSNEIMEHPDLVSNAADVIAQGKMRLSPKFVDRILKSHGHSGDILEAQKKALTGFDMFAVSIDDRNPVLTAALQSLEPIHYSVDTENGRFETAKLFPHLNILIDNDYDDELFTRDLIVEKFLARPKIKLNALFDDDLNMDEGGNAGAINE